MFIGHFALGFGTKPAAPSVSLGTAFLACQLADLIWPTFLVLGIETVRIQPGASVVTSFDFVSYPYTHSLVAMTLWGMAFALAHWALRRPRPVIVVWVGLLVVSHWFLDFVVHEPDLPLTIGGAGRYGLGLWHSLPATLAIELPLFALGVGLYVRATRARDRWGTIGLWGLVVFLLVAYFGNLFGPPPPNAAAIAWAGHAMWLLVLGGYWVDRHRQPRQPAQGIVIGT